MVIKQALFVKSSARVQDCPNAPGIMDFAFIGRSNVGKSSLINMLCGQKALAKVSQTPGKTQLINHFLIDNAWYMVDLPGYGYARAPKEVRQTFQKIITSYSLNRVPLMTMFVLVDARHEPQKIDVEFMRFLGENGVPFSIVFTKADKLKPAELEANIGAYKQRLLEDWEELPPVFVTSSEKRVGREELLAYISGLIKDE